MNRLTGKTAVVIGGKVGIGGEISKGFVEEGAKVYATSRSAGEGQPVDGGISEIKLDVSDLGQLKQTFARLADAGEKIDVLVYNAGISLPGTVADQSVEGFDSMYGINVRAMLFGVQAALPLMEKGGSIVLVGSVAGVIANPGYGAYAATKAAVRSFGQTWATELAPRGIRVNVVSPGPTDTAMFAAVPREFHDAVVSRIPLGRLGQAKEVADTVLFLASDESSYITGADLHVNGGLA